MFRNYRLYSKAINVKKSIGGSRAVKKKPVTRFVWLNHHQMTVKLLSKFVLDLKIQRVDEKEAFKTVTNVERVPRMCSL